MKTQEFLEDLDKVDEHLWRESTGWFCIGRQLVGVTRERDFNGHLFNALSEKYDMPQEKARMIVDYNDTLADFGIRQGMDMHTLFVIVRDQVRLAVTS